MKKALHWVALPNRHDGGGYRRLMRRENGPALFGAWILMVQVASRCPVRGLLIDDTGRALTADDLEMRTDCPASVFRDAVTILTDIGWLRWSSEHHGVLSECARGVLGERSEINHPLHPAQDKTETRQFIHDSGECSERTPSAVVEILKRQGFTDEDSTEISEKHDLSTIQSAVEIADQAEHSSHLRSRTGFILSLLQKGVPPSRSRMKAADLDRTIREERAGLVREREQHDADCERVKEGLSGYTATDIEKAEKEVSKDKPILRGLKAGASMMMSHAVLDYLKGSEE